MKNAIFAFVLLFPVFSIAQSIGVGVNNSFFKSQTERKNSRAGFHLEFAKDWEVDKNLSFGFSGFYSRQNYVEVKEAPIQGNDFLGYTFGLGYAIQNEGYDLVFFQAGVIQSWLTNSDFNSVHGGFYVGAGAGLKRGFDIRVDYRWLYGDANSRSIALVLSRKLK